MRAERRRNERAARLLCSSMHEERFVAIRHIWQSKWMDSLDVSHYKRVHIGRRRKTNEIIFGYMLSLNPKTISIERWGVRWSPPSSCERSKTFDVVGVKNLISNWIVWNRLNKWYALRSFPPGHAARTTATRHRTVNCMFMFHLQIRVPRARANHNSLCWNDLRLLRPNMLTQDYIFFFSSFDLRECEWRLMGVGYLDNWHSSIFGVRFLRITRTEMWKWEVKGSEFAEKLSSWAKFSYINIGDFMYQHHSSIHYPLNIIVLQLCLRFQRRNGIQSKSRWLWGIRNKSKLWYSPNRFELEVWTDTQFLWFQAKRVLDT